MPVRLKVTLAVLAFHVVGLSGVLSQLILGIADLIVVHILGLREVPRGAISLKMHLFVHNLLDDSDVGVVAVVGHRDHGCRG